MPHDVLIESQRLPLRDELALGRNGGDRPLLWVRRLSSGDALVIASGPATRDGLPLLGGLGIVDWGASALVRTGGLRVEIVWRAVSERRQAEAGTGCRLCFGGCEPGEAVVACRCEVAFHLDCDAVRIDCPACGAPRTLAHGTPQASPATPAAGIAA